MGKISRIKIAGKNYPMSFSLMAQKKMAEKYGSTENAFEKMFKDGAEAGSIDMISETIELLISQGCAYKNYFEKDVPVKDDDPVIDGKWTPIPKEAIEIALGIGDMEEIVEKIQECMSGGKKQEIEVEYIEKNAEAGPV